MKSGIYRITINGRIYIGSSVNCLSRKSKHLYYLVRGTHYNNLMQQYYNEHGREKFVFEVIEYCEVSLLVEREQYYLNIVIASGETFNKHIAIYEHHKRK